MKSSDALAKAIHEREQTLAAMVDIGRWIAALYRGMVEGGMPRPQAIAAAVLYATTAGRTDPPEAS